MRIKINRWELGAWLYLLGRYVGGVGAAGRGTLQKMVAANLESLYGHLLVRSAIAKKEYVLKVNVADALAFQFLTEHADPEMAGADVIAINRIIGIIDQKTK